MFEYPQGYELIAGVDEVGRGPLVGAVVTAAVTTAPTRGPRPTSSTPAINLYPCGYSNIFCSL